MKDTRNKRIVIAIMLVAVVLITIGGTFAYFFTTTGRNEEQKLTIKTGNLALTFEDNDSGLTGNIMIGESREKLFIIRNTGTEPVTTNMYWHNLLNTYLKESLSYTFEYKTTEDGDFQQINTVSENVPRTIKAADRILAENITIPADTTYYYKLTITFNNLTDVNQEIDKNAKLMTKFKLGNEEIKIEPIDMTVSQLNVTPQSGNPDFDNVSTTDEGIYLMEDDYGTSYYYRGAVENNYVKFGGFFWRIIRINGDGSIRIIYDGTTAHINGESSTDRFTHTNVTWNKNYDNDAKYIGWMYGGENGVASTKRDLDGTENTQAEKSKAATYNQTNSNVKEKVEEWYNNNLNKNSTNNNVDLTKYLGDELFCNDRSIMTNTSSYWTNLGYGNNSTCYGARSRLNPYETDYVKASPTFKCPQKNDAFTVNDIVKGNGNLSKKIGLITADEVMAAGAGNMKSYNNRNYYLYRGNINYWTISSSSESSMFTVAYSGLSAYNIKQEYAVAPVINIAPEYAATLTGSGTMNSPYQIPGVE